MKRPFWVVIGAGAVLFALAFGSSYWMARQCRVMPGQTPGVLAPHNWAKELGLSSDQQKQLAPMETALQKDLGDIQMRLAQDRMALCGIMRQDPADPKRLEAYVTRVAQLEADQQRRVVSHLLAMRGLLTPAQKDQFFDSLMKGICEGCRKSTHSKQDMCGMCRLSDKGHSR